MFVTTFTASWQLFGIFMGKAAMRGIGPGEVLSFRIDALLVLLMAALAAVALIDMFYKWYSLLTVKSVMSTER
jgi:hypothetical protein